MQNEYRHLSFSSTCKFKFIVQHSVLGTRSTLGGDGASAHPIQGRGAGEVEPIQAVIGQLFMFTFTPVVNLESAIILIPLTECLWIGEVYLERTEADMGRTCKDSNPGLSYGQVTQLTTTEIELKYAIVWSSHSY